MPITPLKRKLGMMIKSGLSAAGLRQLDLARHLGVSTSAVSQMLHGKTAPDARHLETIIELLQCSRNQIFIMRDLLAKIRTGVKELRSPFNEFLSDARKAQNLTFAGLSNLTGIPTSELRAYETCASAKPESEQLEVLANALECNLDELQKELDNSFQTASEYAYPGSSKMLEAAEGTTAYDTDNNTIPIIDAEELVSYNPAFERLQDFIERNSSRQIIYNTDIKDEGIFAITANSQTLFPGLPGNSLLISAYEKFPDSGNLTVAKLKSCDKLTLKVFSRNGKEIKLSSIFDESDSPEITSSVDSKEVAWLRRIYEIIIKDI
jgi:transcriptional regulator with XRE-family HTH domain